MVKHEEAKDNFNLTGSLLVAHPGLKDPNFSKTVVLIANHDAENGSFGIIINRPMDKILGEVKPESAEVGLGLVPVFYGGPVGQQHIVLTAWAWREDNNCFQLHYGLSAEEILELTAHDKSLIVHAFLGHSGWQPGQLKAELDTGSWIVTPVKRSIIAGFSGIKLWQNLLISQRPDLKLLSQLPEFLEFN